MSDRRINHPQSDPENGIDVQINRRTRIAQVVAGVSTVFALYLGVSTVLSSSRQNHSALSNLELRVSNLEAKKTDLPEKAESVKENTQLVELNPQNLEYLPNSNRAKLSFSDSSSNSSGLLQNNGGPDGDAPVLYLHEGHFFVTNYALAKEINLQRKINSAKGQRLDALSFVDVNRLIATPEDPMKVKHLVNMNYFTDPNNPVDKEVAQAILNGQIAAAKNASENIAKR